MKHFLISIFLSTGLFGQYNIVVNIKKCTMEFKNDNTVIDTYSVSTIKRGLPIPNDGYITSVDLHPDWHPTKLTKDYFREHKGIILPNVVPYGHPQNYMGSFKISMTNSTVSRGSVYRIHGTLDESTIGQRVSAGCVRMYNEEGRIFAKKIKTLLLNGERISVKYV